MRTPPPNVIAFAEQLLRETNPRACGITQEVDGWLAESHTFGCRYAAGTPEEDWWDEHLKIYDEYTNDGVSYVIGEPSDEKFVTLTPIRKSLAEPPVACGLCFEWAYHNLPDASNAKLVHAIVQPFGGKFGDRAYPHAWIERAGRVFDWQSATQGYGPGPRGWPRKKFYEIYQPVDVVKYDFAQSRRMVARTRHMGPW